MLYEYYYYNCITKYDIDKVTKIETDKNPLQIEIVEKTETKSKEIKKIQTGINN